jgi:hypothetical protein
MYVCITCGLEFPIPKSICPLCFGDVARLGGSAVRVSLFKQVGTFSPFLFNKGYDRNILISPKGY